MVSSSSPRWKAVKILASVSSGIHAMWLNREKRHAWTIADRCGCPIVCRGGTAAAVPPLFRPSDPALCGSCPLVTPYYCRLGDLLCLFVSALFVCYFVCVCIRVIFVFFMFFWLFSFTAFSFSTLILLVGSFDL